MIIKIKNKKNNQNMVKTGIAVLGGYLKKERNGKWRTSNFEEKGDKFGIVGDRLRVLAAFYLFAKNPKQILLAVGGKGQLRGRPGVPTLAGVIKNELVELGISPRKIMKKSNSNNTYQQLRELMRVAEARGFKKIIIISNKYHLPRIRAMLKTDSALKQASKTVIVKLAAAEKIIINNDRSRWQKIISKAYAGEQMKKRIALEKKGAKDIKKGKYNFNIYN